MTAPLSRSEFAQALAYGQGRAMRHVKEHGMVDVLDLVRDACLHCKSHDPQCEGSRADWLMELIAGEPEFAELAQAILTQLPEAIEADWDSHDSGQLLDLGLSLYCAGVREAEGGLRFAAHRILSEWNGAWHCGTVLVTLDGLQGIERLARLCGAALRADPSNRQPTINNLTDDPDLLQQAMPHLQKMALTDPDIAAYLYANIPLVADSTPSATQREDISLDTVLANAGNKASESRFQFSRFGRRSTPEQRQVLFTAFNQSVDPEFDLDLLKIFSGVAPPTLSPKLKAMLDLENEVLRHAAIRAAGHLQRRELAIWALEALKEWRFGDETVEVLALFEHNLIQEDVAPMMEFLCKHPLSEHAAHSAVMHILSIVGERSAVGLIPLLEWAYVTTPCSLCRQHIVEWLVDEDHLNIEIIHECLFDCQEETRKLAREYLSQREEIK
ncbi:hypothetical protein [Parachitinimonas caeni]|uniref:HEAT repeat domain-containing protein n=1 Tax=Parachitinimonas caeni TaxID=3031301 RepID=A0ABT7E2S2_9NEIS|nr:hypothetical protein [Parachitinimonas caeni]MDK2126618.1 hypothetical protein [Parachitinimonas caeni]